MPRFEFTSPGAAFASEMAKVLAERKAQERQQLLDSLTMNADARAQQQLELEKQRTDAEIASRVQRDEIERIGAYGQYHDPGDVVQDTGIQGLLKKYGAGEEQQPPVPPPAATSSIVSENGAPVPKDPGFTSEAAAPPPPPPSQFVFRGDEKGRERLRKKQGWQDLIASYKASKDPKDQETAEFLTRVGEASDWQADPKEVMDQIAPNVPIYIFDEPSGKFLDPSGKIVDATTIPANAKIVQRSHFPSSFYTEKNPIYVGDDPDNPGNSLFMDPRTHETFSARGQRGSSTQALGIPMGVLNNVQAAIANLGYDPKNVNLQALTDFRNIVSSAVTSARLHNPMSRQMIVSYLNNPGQTSMEIAKLRASGALSARDIDDIVTIIDTLVPAHVKEMLKNNPYDPNQKQKHWYDFIKERINGPSE